MPFRDLEDLQHHKVPLVISASEDGSFPGVAKLSRSRIGELADIKPAVNATLASRQVGVSEKTGPRPDKLDKVRRRRQVRAGLKRRDGADLPASGGLRQ